MCLCVFVSVRFVHEYTCLLAFADHRWPIAVQSLALFDQKYYFILEDVSMNLRFVHKKDKGTVL